jgi:hypothetical protein
MSRGNRGEDREERLRQIQRAFHDVFRQWDRPVRFRKFYRAVLKFSPIVAVCGATLAFFFWISPWPVMQTVKHYVAYPNCDAARAVGLAPAVVGQPGYWLHHDRDRDGIACEVYPAPRSSMPKSSVPGSSMKIVRPPQ